MKTGLCLTALAVTFLGFGAAVNPAADVKKLSISMDNEQLLDDIGTHKDLEELSISCIEGLQSVPDSIGKLARLRELKIDNGNGCSMNPVLPEAIGKLRSLETLSLFGAQDPSTSGSQPHTRHPFPHSMSELKNLTQLDLGRNGFETIPGFVKDLPKLRELGFAWNKLKTIPELLSHLRELTTLKLDGNDLTDLPDFLSTLPRLTHITLGNNCEITQNNAKIKNLRARFPRVRFDFTDEYDCPAK